MNIRAWAESLPNEFWGWGSVNAYPREPGRYCGVLDTVQGMTTPSTMHLLNLAVQQLGPNECYLEVGTWRGATLIGALLNNHGVGVAIDDDSMNDHDGDNELSSDVWDLNMFKHNMRDRVTYVSGVVPDIFTHTNFTALMLDPVRVPVGVYLFDGDKSTERAAHEGLSGVLPFLADEALIFVDDANEINIRRAVYKLNRAYPDNVYTLLDIPTPGNCWPCFWNGIMALAWKR